MRAGSAVSNPEVFVFSCDCWLGGTDVVGVHDGLPRGVSIADNETGWRMALARLATLVETG
jgi:hypothetical protein